MTEITRRQHYVPRFMLEHFVDGDGFVHVFDGEQGKVLPPHRPTDAMMKNYFYDRDNAVENYLSDSIEGPVAALLHRIADESMLPAEAAGIELFRFLGVQISRTPAARAEQLHLQSQMMLTLADRFLQANGYDENTVNDLAIEWNDHAAQHAWRIILGDVSSYLYTDLTMAVLVNQTETRFILGDHPVVQYNWFLREHDLPGTSSMTAPGVQVFMPLSPKLTLMLFDSDVYAIEMGAERRVFLTDPADIAVLNDLQFRARQRFLLANSTQQAELAGALAADIEPSSLTAFSTFTLPGRKLEDGTRTELLGTHRTQHAVNTWLTVSPVREVMVGRELDRRHRHPDMIDGFERLRANVFDGDGPA
jgi:hypothetical protein